MTTEAQARKLWLKRKKWLLKNYDEKFPMHKKLEVLSVPVTESGCHVWIGALNDNGYGRVKERARFRRAHIVAWELVNGPVPDGLVLDHLCRVRCCINPAHLEAVSPSENVRRSNRLRKGESRRGYCGLAGNPNTTTNHKE